ncbi:PREDICTED: tRNA-dihydrouridine(47) synthase [NAD(P)(+)]-like, partial [Gekko japonicus]|uniref:tRNA-dihydrouridine(47) synthase [NAD(P)(+)] n=1 Tax=Gekko japonicus TaxID=146911 RepID=A0ABM1KWP0_GEKJA
SRLPRALRFGLSSVSRVAPSRFWGCACGEKRALGGGGEAGAGMEVPAGVAPIRAPYLTTKEEFHAYLEKEDNPRSNKGDTDGGGDDGGTKDVSSDLSEPPPKVQKLGEDGQEGNLREEAAEELKKPPGGRKRARGQNKNRPCMNPMHYEKHRLCPSIIQERAEKCFFGSQCRFLGPSTKTAGAITDEDIVKLRPCEKKKLDLQGKLYLAPLTTCGNLPFRRICKRFGADVTCGEMAVCTNLLQGQSSEWALLKRHHTEDLFGVQGGGCALMSRTNKFEQIVRGMNTVLDVPLTVKIRTGVQEKVNLAHKIIPNLWEWGASLVTLHGRSREQRYTKGADWEYIAECARLASPMPLFGNGDILSYEDANRAMQTDVSGIMIARGALIKPWIFTEIKEQRHWDISSNERLDLLKDFTSYGLEHWGSDTQGVEKTRKFLLEWLSFLCRYIPAGLMERLPQRINERPPYYMGRDYLETLMASQNVGDWIKISEMLLGPVPVNFTFLPKHKANSYK